MEQESPSLLQRARRNRVVWNATIVTPQGERKARVRDLSQNGVRVWFENEVPALGDVIFKRGNLFAAAQVTWVNGPEVGLEFYRPIEIPLASELRSVVCPSS